MEYRKLGKTGLEISLLGLGGFHLLEISLEKIRGFVKTYLDAGGNYFETAHAYGNGESERKLSKVLPSSGVVIATKTGKRTAEEAKRELLKSLKNLNRKHVDILFLHAVTDDKDWDRIISSGGAIEALEWAKVEGLVRFVGITSHGYGGTLLRALKEYPFDLFMTQFNYYDRFNFPEIETKVLPFALSNNIGIIAMKPLADGFLFRSVERAFRYVKTLPVSCIVSGINSLDQLKRDIEVLDLPVYDELELAELQRLAPELGNYVCRLCLECLPCPEGINIPAFFLAEGRFDRQMLNGEYEDVQDYALRDRLAHWFQSEKQARLEYQTLSPGVSECTECGVCSQRCPYNIDIPRKLKIVKSKFEKGYIW